MSLALLQQLLTEKLHGLGYVGMSTLYRPYAAFLFLFVCVSGPQGFVRSLSDLSLNLNLLEALIVSYGFHYCMHSDDIQIRGSR